MRQKRTKKSLPILKRILDHRELLNKGIHWNIGNGMQIRFWLNNQVGNGPPIKFLNPSKKDDINTQEIVSEYIKQDTTWNVQLLSHVIHADIINKLCLFRCSHWIFRME